MKRATSIADGSEWAVKIIDKTKLDADDEAALKVEVEILQTVSTRTHTHTQRATACVGRSSTAIAHGLVW